MAEILVMAIEPVQGRYRSLDPRHSAVRVVYRHSRFHTSTSWIRSGGGNPVYVAEVERLLL